MMNKNPKPIVTMKIGDYSPKPKTPDEIAEINLSANARAMPDAMFKDNPDVIRAAADVDAWATRFKRISECAYKGNELHALVDAISIELANARQAYRFACLDSFLTGELEFNSAIAAKERTELLGKRLDAAKTAMLDIDQINGYEHIKEFRDLAAKATVKLGNILFALKREAVQHKEAVTR